MDRIVIRPHHDRWGLYEDPDAPPVSEYETRELAELAARDRGAEVVVEGGEPRDSETEPQGDAPVEPGRHQAGEGARERQAGL